MLDAAKAGTLIFLAAILQAAVFSDVVILDGTPNLLLVTIVCVALLRGPLFGAAGGFLAGLLLDVAELATLGLSSLLLTLAGYWTGRYGETTGRDRGRAAFVAVAVITFLYALGGLLLHAILGQPAPARTILLDSLFQTIALNLLITYPVYRLARLLLRVRHRAEAVQVHLLG